MKSLAGSGGSFGQLLRMSASYPDLKMPAPDLAHHQPKPAAHGFMSLFSALLYGSVAIAMNFVNKGTLMFFPHSSFILLLQMMAGIVIVQVLRACGQVKLSHGFSRKKLMQLLPLCLLYNMNTGTALMCLSKVSVPVYSTMKRLTPMLVLGTKICTTRQLPHPRILLSVVLVVVGCVIAGYGDLSFDAAGYAFAFMSASFQATYLILVEHTGSEKGIGSAELLLYNSVLSLPFLLIVATATGELGQIGEAYRAAIAASASFPLLLVLCSVMGCLLNYSIFLCTMNNSALTTTIVGVLKGVLSTLLGFFLLGGVKFNWLNVVGICMNTCGGVIYTITKYERRRRRSMSLRGGGGGEWDYDPEAAPLVQAHDKGGV